MFIWENPLTDLLWHRRQLQAIEAHVEAGGPGIAANHGEAQAVVSLPAAGGPVTVTPTQVGMAALDKFFASGGGLAYSNLPLLTLDLSSAYDDVVNLTRSPTTGFGVFDSLAAYQAGHGARLNLNLAVVINPVNASTGHGTGQWTFANRLPVAYGHLGTDSPA